MSTIIKEVHMRVTKKTKEKTRAAIISSARKLFSEKGFDKTVTREIASVARIAAGTLFNYFPSKEALGMEIICHELTRARDDYAKLRRGEESLEEDLFLHIITGLRRLAEHRGYVADILETALSPFASGSTLGSGEQVRIDHLETVASVIVAHHAASPPSFVAIHLYWTLYLGVLAFWSKDQSPHQEDTLVLLDQSLRLFVASLSMNHSQRGVDDDTQDQ